MCGGGGGGGVYVCMHVCVWIPCVDAMAIITPRGRDPNFITVSCWPALTLLLLLARSKTFNGWTEFTVATGKRNDHMKGMPLVTRMFA
jgi:hypothetical protein